MDKLRFNISIDASREKVWKILWGNDTYPQWTAPFSEGSHVETDWKKGSRVLFLNDKGEGMVATIADNIPNEFMSIKHLAEMKGGVEHTSGQAQEWSGAMENYTLKTINGKTELTIDTDITDEYKEEFQRIWPQALDKLKELAEKS